MKRKLITIIMTMFLLVSMLIVAFNSTPASGHIGDVLTAWAITPPTIDGLISPANEWDNAAQVSVFTGSYAGSVFYVMNDEINLYLALKVVDSTFMDNDMVSVRFDNDHNGVTDVGDDKIFPTKNEFRDCHYRRPGPGWGAPDSLYIDGSSDGSSAAGRLNGANFFEVSHPLNSGDPYDFSLSAGDIVGFCLTYFDDGTAYGWCSVYPPSSRAAANQQLLYGDIMIASPVTSTIDVDPDTLNLVGNGPWITAYVELSSGYDVADIDVASIELSCDTYTDWVDPDAPAEIGDYDGDGIPDLMVKFDRLALVDYLQTIDYSDADGKFYDLPIIITGTVAGTPFEGTDTIRVRK